MRRQPTATLIAATILAVAAAVPTPAQAQETERAATVLERSMAYHDPDNSWFSGSYRLVIAGTRPIAGPTMTTVVIDNVAGRFHMERDRFGTLVETTVTGDECWTRLNGSSEISEQQEQRMRLSCEQMRTTRDYHTYLYGLPMKLRDDGTIIDPEAVMSEFNGDRVWQVRVTYEPEVGGDTWYFYFDPQSFAMVGYRFYHDESANDGEYIVLDREVTGGGVRLPKVRSWYRNSDDELLGTDTIRRVEKLSH